jgi:hypothetical protein
MAQALNVIILKANNNQKIEKKKNYVATNVQQLEDLPVQ